MSHICGAATIHCPQPLNQEPESEFPKPRVVLTGGPQADTEAMNRGRANAGEDGFLWKARTGCAVYQPQAPRGTPLAKLRAQTVAMVRARGWT